MEIKVDRTNLISILKQNMQIHQEEYSQLMSAFYKNVALIASRIVTKAERSDEDITLRIDAIRPVSNMKDYETILGMLELSTDNEFTLSEKDYKKYVLDEWDWSRSFAVTKTSYGMS